VENTRLGERPGKRGSSEENNSLSKIPLEFSKEKQVSLPFLRAEKDEVREGMSTNRAGIVEISPNYRLIIPLLQGTTLGNEKVKVTVTRVKADYAFAQIDSTSLRGLGVKENKSRLFSEAKKKGEKENSSGNNLYSASSLLVFPEGENLGARDQSRSLLTTTQLTGGENSAHLFSSFSTQSVENTPLALQEGQSEEKGKVSRDRTSLVSGCKFTTTLPLIAPRYGQYLVLKMKESILFLKVQKGISLGDKVRIKIISSLKNCAVGKILQINPISQNQKTALIMNSIRDMINHGLHFGEKAVKCHARMKNYIWLKKQGLVSNPLSFSEAKGKKLKEKNRPLIKKGRHVINLLKTRRCLTKALNALTKYALKGRTFLFIGTKKPATGLVARASFFTKNSFYVNTRWLGGMLTNWKTICKSISKIRPILKEKQKVVRDILERRQTIKARLIKKALLLRKKSKLILTKGRFVLNLLKNTQTKTEMTLRAQKLTVLRNDFVTKGMDYLQKRQKLIQKRRELIYQTLLLKEKGFQMLTKYKGILNQLASYTKKLREYKYLLILTAEIQKMKSVIRPYSISYGKLKQVVGTTDVPSKSTFKWIIPNPPKEILNRIVLTMKNQYEQESVNLLAGKSTNNIARLFSENSESLGIFAKKKEEKSDMVICSTLLSKFSGLNSYIKSVIYSLVNSIKLLETQAHFYETELMKIKNTLVSYLSLKNRYVQELQNLKTKLTTERNVIQLLKRKLKALDAQKKLIKFLPRLRYLPTPQTKISQIVQVLLSKIVDPKFKYPIDAIYDQKLSTSSKKLAAARKKKWQRLEKYFGGIANMTKLTKTNISRNVAIIIGQKEEMNAVRECQKLGIKLFTIVDTNCNPTLSDHIVPANDDSRNAIKYILTKFITRIRLAQKLRSRLQKLQKTN
jgi:small subunit ribosomal protein S2